MSSVHKSLVKIEEVRSELAPEGGASLEDVLRDAAAIGAHEIIIDRARNRVIIIWLSATPE